MVKNHLYRLSMAKLQTKPASPCSVADNERVAAVIATTRVLNKGQQHTF